jgi:hypothetical protein
MSLVLASGRACLPVEILGSNTSGLDGVFKEAILDGKGEAGDVEVGRNSCGGLLEKGCKRVGVERSRHQDHSEVGASGPQQVAQNDQQKVRVD